MAIEFDMSRPIRRPSERVALVEAVLTANPSDEYEWIEWKREVPLGTAAGNFTAARYVLGFSNRGPEQAARFLGGQAYLLVGVEPRNLVGAPAIDPAKLEDWLRPYLGSDGPVWDAHNVDVRGDTVLAIEVAPPRGGDPIQALRKEYEVWHAGAIFVRRKGKTAEANPAEIAMLTSRAGAAADRVSVEVSLAGNATITPLHLSGQTLADWIESRRDSLLRPVHTASAEPDDRDDSAAATPRAVSGTLSSLVRESERAGKAMQRAMGYEPEDRTPEEYQNEVESHLEKLRVAAPIVAAARAMAAGVCRLVPAVKNPTETNFRQVLVQLHIPGSVRAVDAEEEDAWAETSLPSAPRAFGSMKRPAIYDVMSSLAPRPLPPLLGGPAIRRSGLEIEHDGSATLTFDPMDLRPLDVVELDAFHLFVSPDLAGEKLEATWEATSTSADGVASGSLPIHVGDTPQTLAQLLERQASEAD